MKLSACMIVKNEEKNIERCIKSYRKVVDEIIVVDTGSTDRSIELAKAMGANVYFFGWIDDFAAAKNYAISKAQGDWIIFLDADEFFLEEVALQIPQFIQTIEFKAIDAVFCKMYNIDEGSNQLLNEMIQVRLFRNSNEIVYEGPIHEKLVSKRGNLRTIVAEEKEISIYHTGYSAALKVKKAERNIQLLLKQIEYETENPEPFYHLSRAYSAIDNYDKSIRYAQKFLSMGNISKEHERNIYYTLLSDMMANKNKREEIEEVVEQAIKLEPKDGMPYMLVGQYYFSINRYEHALEALKMALKLNDEGSTLTLNFVESRRSEIYTLLGNIYEVLGDFLQAQSFYQMALELEPSNDVALMNWMKIFKEIQSGDVHGLAKIYKAGDLNLSLKLLHLAAYFKEPILLQIFNDFLKDKYQQQDFSIVMLMLFQKKYVEASRYLMEIYETTHSESYILLIWIGAYIANDFDLMGKSEQLIKDETKTYLRACRRNELMLINPIYFDWIWEWTKQTYFLDKDQFKYFSKWLENILETNGELKKVFYAHIKNEKFFGLLKHINPLDKTIDLGLYLTAIRNYLEFDFIEAKSCFEQLANRGFEINACECYLKWISRLEIEMDTMLKEKAALVENIQNLIQGEQWLETQSLMEQYQSQYGKDAEYYSIEGVIQISKNNYELALINLKEGLKLAAENFDLNYNMGYLYGLLGELGQAKKYMLVAHKYCVDEEIRKSIEHYMEQ